MLSRVSQINQKIGQRLQLRYRAWLKRRMPSANVHQLTSRNVFIFPTLFGFAYLLFVLLLFLLATNYQNNLIMLLSYLLASLFITAMLHSFFNFSQLTIKSQSRCSGYTHRNLAIPITVTANSIRHDFRFAYDGQEQLVIPTLAAEDNAVSVPFYQSERGVYPLDRIKIASEYSFGLFTTWTRLDLNVQVWVYPEPKALPSIHRYLSFGDTDESHTESNIRGHDEFYELNKYRAGEPLSHVAWKQLARGRGWFSKGFHQTRGSDVWLKLSDMPSANIEQKLSYLCYLVLEYEQIGRDYGLDLISLQIAPNNGNSHLQQCLEALALYKT